MRNRTSNSAGVYILLISTILVFSCRDEWRKHYQDETSKAANIRIADYIKSIPEFSKFSQMLEITGYDSILNASQTFTVWAPVNTALANIDLNDTTMVSDIVKNHIARFSYPTSGILSEYVKMINGKRIQFFKDDNGFHFGNTTITIPNTLVTNGIIHKLDGYVPFNFNIWEYIMNTAGLDSLKTYLSSQHKRVIDYKRSIAVAIDTLGNTVYDTVFSDTNVLLDRIGHLDAEDSVYTSILPDNTAWNEAYNRIKQYFVPNPSVKGSMQRDSTQYSLIRDMVFRKRILPPFAFDSLISTTGNVFHQPAYLFNNATSEDVSNGSVYVTSLMPFIATDSWHKKIQVEAESSSGRLNINSNIYLKYSYGSLLNVSKQEFIVVEPTTTSSISKVYVDFSIPHTLSAKYNIYCVFVPGSILNASDTLPNRAVFYLLNYSNNKWVVQQQFSVSSNVTDPHGITKMLIATGYKFTYYDPSLTQSTANIRIRVQNDVGINETTLSRSMRIDKIILEPVSE